MSGPGYLCPNGHPATLAGQRYCELCGATMGGQPVAPPPVQPPGWPPAPQSAPPPGWTPAPPVSGYGAPPATPPVSGGGGRRGPLILAGLLLVAAVAIGGVFVVLRPFGGPGATPSPVALASITPAPARTAAPSGAAIVSPTASPSVVPSVAPSIEPTATPPQLVIESVAPSTPDGLTCRSEAVGLTVTYPAGWSTVTDGSQWTCLLFDPTPIIIAPQTELPPVAVSIFAETRSYAATRKDFETAAVYTVNGTDSGSVDGHDATAYELENTGQGFYEKGVLQAVVVVDLGDRGCLVIETVGTAGDAYDANVQTLVGMLDALKLD